MTSIVGGCVLAKSGSSERSVAQYLGSSLSSSTAITKQAMLWQMHRSMASAYCWFGSRDSLGDHLKTGHS
jgi:hypothetical protein